MILTVVDVGGLCVMTIPSRWLDLDQPVLTKIELRDYNISVVGLTLLVIRTEYIHDVRYRSSLEGLPLSTHFITSSILTPLSSFLLYFFASFILCLFSTLPLLFFLPSSFWRTCQSFFTALPTQRCHASDFFRQILAFRYDLCTWQPVYLHEKSLKLPSPVLPCPALSCHCWCSC